MLNTRDLEERWLKYKIKSYIPHITIIISLIVILILGLTFFNSSPEEKIKKVFTEKKISKEIVVQNRPKSTPQKAVVQIKAINYEEVPLNISRVKEHKPSKNEERPLTLTPSLDFMKKMQHSSLPYYQEEPTLQQKPISQIVEEVQEVDVKEATETVEQSTPKIIIKRRDSRDDIRHIIKRFKKNNSPALSLFIAKKYYELGEYHKAYNYALITNQIDKDIDASWIIFSKSLVKLNQKEMAIKTLKQYIEDSHSSSAKILLDDILLGKFK